MRGASSNAPHGVSLFAPASLTTGGQPVKSIPWKTIVIAAAVVYAFNKVPFLKKLLA